MNALSLIKVMRAIRRLASAATPGCNGKVVVGLLEDARGCIDEALTEMAARVAAREATLDETVNPKFPLRTGR